MISPVNNNRPSNLNLWLTLAKVSALTALLVSVLLVVNYAQYKTIKPVESEMIHSLVQRLSQNPDDTQLRDEIRALDLLSRKAFFTQQWQIKTGGYILLLSVVVLLISMQLYLAEKGPVLVSETADSSFFQNKKARRGLTIFGGIALLLAFTVAFLTYNDLGSTFEQAAAPVASQAAETTMNELPASPEIETENAEMLPQETSVDTVAVAASSPEIISQPENSNEPGKADFPTMAEIRQNFPAFRGPESNGISYAKNIPTQWNGTTNENILWKVKIPLSGYNSPVIWGNKLFLSGANAQKREVYCIDRNSGQFLWTTAIENVPGSPAQSPKVTDDTGLAAPSLTTNGTQVFAIFGNGDVAALDMNGKIIWSRNMGPADNHYGYSSSLVLFEDILIVQYDSKVNPRIVGIHKNSGEIAWETPRKVKISWASPVLAHRSNGTEVLLVAEPTIASYNPKTGAENWQIKCLFGEVGPSVAWGDGLVFGVNEYAKLVAIEPTNPPKILWESDELLSDVPSPVVHKNLLFLATSYGVMACYDTKTGEKYWEQEFDKGFYGSPMLVQERIYIVDKGGVVHVFEAASEYVSVGENPLGEAAMTTPAFMDGRIYIRSNENLFCIGQ